MSITEHEPLSEEWARAWAKHADRAVAFVRRDDDDLTEYRIYICDAKGNTVFVCGFHNAPDTATKQAKELNAHLEYVAPEVWFQVEINRDSSCGRGCCGGYSTDSEQHETLEALARIIIQNKASGQKDHVRVTFDEPLVVRNFNDDERQAWNNLIESEQAVYEGLVAQLAFVKKLKEEAVVLKNRVAGDRGTLARTRGDLNEAAIVMRETRIAEGQAAYEAKKAAYDKAFAEIDTKLVASWGLTP